MKKYPNDLIGDIMKAFGKYADRPAFVIEDTACTYGELATCVQKISSLFKDREDSGFPQSPYREILKISKKGGILFGIKETEGANTYSPQDNTD